MKKPISLDKAIAMMPERAMVMVGGFVGVGSPSDLSTSRCGNGKNHNAAP